MPECTFKWLLMLLMKETTKSTRFQEKIKLRDETCIPGTLRRLLVKSEIEWINRENYVKLTN